MTESGATFDWMRLVLDQLFDAYQKSDLIEVINDPRALATVRADLSDRLDAAHSLRIPAGDKGDNLIMALIALRLKFERDQAFVKLEKNIAFRLEATQS